MGLSRTWIVATVVLAVAAAGLLIGLSQWSAHVNQTPDANEPSVHSERADPANGTAPLDTAPTSGPSTPHPVMGDPDAPVTIVEFAEFYCPFCAKFMWETFPQIEAAYIETGKARYVFRNWPVHGMIAVDAAVAGECAHDQDAFWAYSDATFERVFPNRNLSNIQTLSMDELKEIAAEIGLNTTAFNRCLDGYAQLANQCRSAYESCQDRTSDSNACNAAFMACLEQSDKFTAVMADNQSLSDFVNALSPEDRGRADRLGTPTFFVNDRLLVGAQPYSAFERLIEEELNRASSGP